VQRSETTSQDAWASSAAKRNDQPSFKKREIFTSRLFLFTIIKIPLEI